MDYEKIDQNAKTVLISLNPRSGASDQATLATRLAEELEAQGLTVLTMTNIDLVKAKVGELCGNQEGAGRLRCVVAAGGDGTVSLLVNTLPVGIPIAILPLGTENLLAKYLTITASPKSIAEMIIGGKMVKLDAGSANGHLFLVMASCGFDAEVVHRLHSSRKGHIQHLSYAKPIFGAIGKYRYPTIRIWADGEEKPVKAKWTFIFNVPRYAMNLPFVQDADPQDAKLDLLTFRGGNLVRGLFYLFTVLIHRHRSWKYAKHLKLPQFRMESDEQVPYQLDGDPGGVLPVDIKVVPQRLLMIVPLDWQKGHLTDNVDT